MREGEEEERRETKIKIGKGISHEQRYGKIRKGEEKDETTGIKIGRKRKRKKNRKWEDKKR